MKPSIKLICFDLNKTLIRENTWLELNQALGMTADEDQKLYDSYNSGKLSYVDWQKELEKIYISRGLASKEYMLKAINTYSYLPGAKSTIKYLQSRNYALSIISGSIDLLVEKVANELGVKYYSANNYFEFDENNNLLKMNCLGEDKAVKVEQVQNLCQSLSIDVDEVACVGDGDNDLGLFELTKHGITFKGSKIEKQAWKVIDQLPDLKNLF